MEEQEGEMDTRCMVTQWKGAAATDGSNHSSLHSSTSRPTHTKSSGPPPISHPPNSLITLQFLCVLCVATDANKHGLGVCLPPNGLEIANTIAMFAVSWYFSMFIPCFSPMFDLTLLALKTITCTSVPHTEYRFRDLVPCPPPLPHAGLIVESASTDPVHT